MWGNMPLQPCPFCGSQDRVVLMRDENLRLLWGCQHCEHDGPTTSDKKGAQEKWNVAAVRIKKRIAS